MSAEEKWSTVAGYEGIYEVSSKGRVRRVTRTHLHAPGFEPAQHRNSNGYVKVGLYKDGRYALRSVHRLVAIAFLGGDQSESSLEVCHRDGDQTNNDVRNLYWGTSTQNQLDTVRHGRHAQAAKTHCQRGHSYDEANTLRIGNARKCRACHRENQARSRAAAGTSR